MSKVLNNSSDDNLNFDISLSESIPNERRKVVREERQQAQGSLYYQLKLDQFAKQVFETRIGRLLYFVVLLIMLIVLTWELAVRVTVIDNNLLLNDENARLTLQLEHLRSKWSDNELKKIETSIKKEEEKIFSSVPSLADWINAKKVEAKNFGFDFKYRIEKATKTGISKTYTVPVILTLSSSKSEVSGYKKVLAFVRRTIEENRRIEINAIEAKSAGLSLNYFVISINVWVKDPSDIITTNNENEGKADAEFVQ